MDAISQTTSSSAFSWMKMFEFRLKFQWSLFLRSQLTIFQHLVQIIAWRRPGDKPLSEPMMVNLLTHIWVTRSQWVNTWRIEWGWHHCIRYHSGIGSANERRRYFVKSSLIGWALTQYYLCVWFRQCHVACYSHAITKSKQYYWQWNHTEHYPLKFDLPVKYSLEIHSENMMTSSNGNIFRVTGHLSGEFTCPRWIPHTKASDAGLYNVFFDLRLNKRLSKQSWGWWFETLPYPLCRHCNAGIMEAVCSIGHDSHILYTVVSTPFD